MKKLKSFPLGKCHIFSLVKISIVFIADTNVYTDFTSYTINRGSYMSAHVLLILLNELGKRDKMRGLPSILSFFRNEFNKFNKTRTRMSDSIYHITLRIM